MSETPPVKQTPTFVIVRETVLESWLHDASTWALAAALIAPGWMLGSSAMQWAGFVVFLAAMLARSSGKYKRMNVTEARVELARIETEAAEAK